MAGSDWLRPAFASRNDNGSLQGTDWPSASSPRLGGPADRGCHWRGGSEQDAGSWTPEIRSMPAGHRVAAWGWGRLVLHPTSAPTPIGTLRELARRLVRAAQPPQIMVLLGRQGDWGGRQARHGRLQRISRGYETPHCHIRGAPDSGRRASVLPGSDDCCQRVAAQTHRPASHGTVSPIPASCTTLYVGSRLSQFQASQQASTMSS